MVWPSPGFANPWKGEDWVNELSILNGKSSFRFSDISVSEKKALLFLQSFPIREYKLRRRLYNLASLFCCLASR